MMIDILKIIRPTLIRLSNMDYERTGGRSLEQLILPLKKQAKGEKDRVSEQELRILFIEEFKKEYPALFYSIETPTVGKFRFCDSLETDEAKKQSALHDMCIFNRDIFGKYNRVLNIEFKHKNTNLKNIEKDIWKLIAENQDGVFIQLLNNTNSGTLCSYLNKLGHSFEKYHTRWNHDDKSIQIFILSLKQKTFIYRTFYQTDMINLDNIFSIGSGNIDKFNSVEWKKEQL